MAKDNTGGSDKKLSKNSSDKAFIKKKTLGDKFKESFVRQDIRDVGDELLKKKIFPGIISMIRDVIWDGITMHFNLDGSRSPFTSSSRPGYTNYQQASKAVYGGITSYGGSESKPPKQVNREGPEDFRSIFYRTEDIASGVLYSIKHDARKFGWNVISIKDLYSYSDLTNPRFTDDDWGWKIEVFDKVKVKSVMVDGDLAWVIDLPNAIPLKEFGH